MRMIKFMPLLIGMLLTGCTSADQTWQRSFFAMDTYAAVTLNGKNAEKTSALVEQRVRELESLWSVTNENSELYAINHSGGKGTDVSPETADLISFSAELWDVTDGALDITLYPLLTEWGFTANNYRIPDSETINALLQNKGVDRIKTEGLTVTVPDNMMLDLGAVGKGAAGDEAVKLIRGNGIDSAVLDLGGNIHAVGSKPDGSPWRIGIRDPFGEGTAGVLEVTDCAVITSGGYERCFIGEDGERYCHILDPETGAPARSGIASVTVIGSEGRLCDGLSTAIFVMGTEKAEKLWRSRSDFDMIIITDEGNILLTAGIADSFTAEPSFDGVNITVIG